MTIKKWHNNSRRTRNYNNSHIKTNLLQQEIEKLKVEIDELYSELELYYKLHSNALKKLQYSEKEFIALQDENSKLKSQNKELISMVLSLQQCVLLPRDLLKWTSHELDETNSATKKTEDNNKPKAKGLFQKPFSYYKDFPPLKGQREVDSQNNSRNR